MIAILLAIAAVGCVGLWFTRPRRLPANRVRRTRIMLRLRMHPGKGFATCFELWLRWGRFASFRQSRRARPSLSIWRRLRSREHSVFLGRAHRGHGLRLPVQEHAVIMAPPRTGKSGFLAKAVLHHPGSVISATTRSDIFAMTSGLRSQVGPVHVFNPQGIGGVPSSFRWNPIEGCQDEATAIRRADAFASSVSMKGAESSEFWSAKASDYLRAFFCAGAILGADFRRVARWVGGKDTAEAIDALYMAGHNEWAATLAELSGPAERTAATVRMVMSRAVTFMSDPALAASVLPPHGQGLDLDAFLEQRGTLYLIGEGYGSDSPVAPLFACLTTELHHAAVQLGSAMRGSRLDPPLMMALDEVTQIVPVPLPQWMADSGGKGIQLLVVCHGEAQLRTRWDASGARAIMDTAGAKILLPGISDVDTLEMASKLAGQVAIKEHGRDEHARHPICPPEVLRELPPGRALILRGSLGPVIAKLPMVWHDRAYRKARRRDRATVVLLPAPEPFAAEPMPALADLGDAEHIEAREPDLDIDLPWMDD